MEVNMIRPEHDRLTQGTESDKNEKGRLKIYFGYAAGVGKTYAMLDDARELQKHGVDVVIGYIESHTRPETLQLLKELPVLPRKAEKYQNVELTEFDIDGALKRKPQLIIIDNLSHTNMPGARNKKRYQDVEELLNAGIDVVTSMSVQHLESLKDVVENITGIKVRDTVPDNIFEYADQIELVDIEPEELLFRLRTGKVFKEEQADKITQHYFTKENLRILRELAMRKAADRISHDNQKESHSSEKMSNSKLLVCISSSPTSAKSIRWASRMAESMHAPWVAVYIDKEESIFDREEQKKALQANMELAEQLGAEVVTLNGYDVAITISEYARLSGITNIVIGKSRNRKTIKNFFEMDLEDKLISLMPNIEVHIIPNSNILRYYKKPWKISFLNQSFSWRDSIITSVLLIGASGLSLFQKILNIEEHNVILIFILSVLIISRVTKGYFYGIFASIISVIMYNYIFAKPYFAFTPLRKENYITFLIMLLVALITSAVTIRAKTQAIYAVDRERRTEILYEINKKLLVTRGLENIVQLTNEYITKIFSRSAIIYTEDPDKGGAGSIMAVNEDIKYMDTDFERQVAHWVYVNQKRAGAGTDTFSQAVAFYMPVLSQGNVLGVIGLSCLNKNYLTQNNRSFLRMIASQVAMALERQRLSDEQRLILIQREKEKMRSNLLRAISHDLRTPLTSILGASSTILENSETIEKETQNKLLSNIKEESQWLIRMVENLLSVTRISEETSEVKKTPEAVEEIVAEAISRIRKRFKDSNINVQVPKELLFVPMDGILIEQVLINLIENGMKHSSENPTIDVVVKKDKDFAIFEVSDNGSGIKEENFSCLLESYVPNRKHSSDSSRGMGIGLSICMSIVKAHGGKMEFENKQGGGAVFRFTLPLDGEKNNVK
ncbi:sensor histidine kinase KdpD [Anaerocolumna aminovalerica]|nr:sensor histidine kinase KdpD [Anaerocolumna aminovalerica]